jgi:hypothetical protein
VAQPTYVQITLDVFFLWNDSIECKLERVREHITSLKELVRLTPSNAMRNTATSNQERLSFVVVLSEIFVRYLEIYDHALATEVFILHI